MATRFRIVEITLVVLFAWALPLNAATKADLDALHAALRTNDMIAILSDEGITDAIDLQDDMFPGRGGAAWRLVVQNIYAPDSMVARFRAAFDRELAETDIAGLLKFYHSPVGQRVTEAEVRSRKAITSDAVEEAARAAHSALLDENPDRASLLVEFVGLNDLIERNVAGAMTTNLAFFRGLAEGGAFQMGEGEMMSMVWEQETEIRDDTTGWVYAYLTLTYEVLSDAEFRDFTAVSATDAGRALNRALFAGFYEAFQSISFDLGRGAAGFMVGEDL